VKISDVLSRDSSDYDTYKNPVEGKTYISPSLENGYGEPGTIRIVTRGIEQPESYEFAKIKGETVLRRTPGGKNIITAKVFEDSRKVTYECCELNITLARNADRLPHDVRSAINSYVTKKGSSISPIDLCDEGWRDVYKQMTQDVIDDFNTPKVRQIKDLFSKHIGTTDSRIVGITNIDRLDDFVRFRGEITHRVKASSYVKIEKVVEGKELIAGLVMDIDRMLLDYLRSTYSDRRAPWNNTY